MDRQSVKVMILDDEEALLRILSRVVEDRGYSVFPANCSDEGLAVYEREKPDICILDLALDNSKINGLDVLSIIREKDKDMICIVLTCYAEDDDMQIANDLGIFSCLFKPLKSEEVMQSLEQAAELVCKRRGS